MCTHGLPVVSGSGHLHRDPHFCPLKKNTSDFVAVGAPPRKPTTNTEYCVLLQVGKVATYVTAEETKVRRKEVTAEEHKAGQQLSTGI